jgi:hypothetical protein
VSLNSRSIDTRSLPAGAMPQADPVLAKNNLAAQRWRL